MKTLCRISKRRAPRMAAAIALGCVAMLAAPVPPQGAAAAAGAKRPTLVPASATATPAKPSTATAAPAKPSTAITRLEIQASPFQTTISLAARPHPPVFHAFYLHHPDRWVLDLKDASDGLPREHWKVLNSGITDVRAGQFEPNVVRVVLDLNEPVHPQVSAAAGRLEISVKSAANFSATPATTATASPKRAAEGAPKKAPSATAMMKKPAAAPAPFVAAIHPPVAAAPATTALVPSATTTAPAAAAAREPQPPAPAPAVKTTALAGSTAAHFAPAATSAVAPAARPLPPPAAAVLRPTPQTAASSPTTPRGVAPPSLQQPLIGTTPGTGEPTVYTGERITLNLKNADLTDFFRLINQISGLNIIVDPAVKGTVTMVLQEVPWDQALDIVLRNNGLGRKLEGNVLYIATMKTLQAQNQEIADLKKSQAAAAPFVDKVIPLNYAKADDVAKILTTKGFVLGENEMVTTDSRTNALILHVHPDTLPAIDSLVTRLDRKTPQVEIEARVVAATRNFVRDLGVQLGFGAGNAASAVGGASSVGASQTITNIANPKYVLSQNPAGTLPLNVNLGATAPTSGIAFINASSTFRLDAILTAAESKGLGHILSRPKVVTQNNMQAMVQQGVRIPVQTTINNTISVQFFNVTLRLTVTPQITADNTIFMNVDVENDAIDSGIPPVNGIPAIDTQQATTNVLVANGGTVVIGGVMINNNQNAVFQVPFLGSLPIIGNLFKRQSVNNTSQELLFFITPHIVQG